LQKYEDRLGAAVQERGLLQLHKIIATAQPAPLRGAVELAKSEPTYRGPSKLLNAQAN
jgi:hypothetical protein